MDNDNSIASNLENYGFGNLVDIMRRLRAPGGCPWDKEQTLSSLRRYILEEAHELVEAIDSGEPRDICEECGDLMLQVVFAATVTEESGLFGINDVCRVICEKLVRRHPHVFGDVSVENSDEVLRNWEAIKAGERRNRSADSSAMAGIPKGMPALLRAWRISERAAKKGFDWKSGDIESVRAKVLEELDELRAEMKGANVSAMTEEMGDLMFSLANLSRHLGIDPENTLQLANEKFIRRFREMENLASRENAEMEKMSLDELELLWQSAKNIES
ncbi:MAG: nucleoside triphosphate pyrophosphohydrolase [Synergistaceae bacterium]|nr:nucleoside triphosphate pyrophosphohydrolase [Synergistaceae bacterium]